MLLKNQFISVRYPSCAFDPTALGRLNCISKSRFAPSNCAWRCVSWNLISSCLWLVSMAFRIKHWKNTTPPKKITCPWNGTISKGKACLLTWKGTISGKACLLSIIFQGAMLALGVYGICNCNVKKIRRWMSTPDTPVYSIKHEHALCPCNEIRSIVDVEPTSLGLMMYQNTPAHRIHEWYDYLNGKHTIHTSYTHGKFIPNISIHGNLRGPPQW